MTAPTVLDAARVAVTIESRLTVRAASRVIRPADYTTRDLDDMDRLASLTRQYASRWASALLAASEREEEMLAMIEDDTAKLKEMTAVMRQQTEALAETTALMSAVTETASRRRVEVAALTAEVARLRDQGRDG